MEQSSLCTPRLLTSGLGCASCISQDFTRECIQSPVTRVNHHEYTTCVLLAEAHFMQALETPSRLYHCCFELLFIHPKQPLQPLGPSALDPRAQSHINLVMCCSDNHAGYRKQEWRHSKNKWQAFWKASTVLIRTLVF